MSPPTADAMFFNRELSWLAFNTRVLEEAQNRDTPLLERARFLAIVTNNLHEFCMVRLAELRRNRKKRKRDPAGLTPKEQFDRVREGVARLITDQYACWKDEVRPALAAAGFTITAPAEWTDDDRASLASLYHDRLEPILTPMAVDPTRPFPLIGNLGIHLAVLLRDPATPDGIKHCLVSIPAGKRLVPLPGEDGRYALREDVVEQQLGALFRGFQIVASCQFRTARDGQIDLDDEQADDLLSELEQELRARAHGAPVILEIKQDADPALVKWLHRDLKLDAEDTVTVPGPLDLTLLFNLPPSLSRPGLEYVGFTPRQAPDNWDDPFAAIRDGDLLVHHPFDAFEPITILVEKAANDPRVLAIKQTLYRVSGDSPIIRALIRAAHAGKQVTVLLELRARFDEQANIRWARQLERAGAHVIYGLKGLKVHTKLLLIIRRDEDGIRRYCHLGTGNYNDKTARVYTDLGYFTCHEAVGQDLANLFNVITGFCLPPDWFRLAVAPTSLRSSFVACIRREADLARAGRPASIVAKFNSLVDTAICEELYAASQAGVDINLLVRGMCILRPGVPGLSERILVRSIVGRFLEHSRIYRFENDGAPRIGLSSADWMTRNLDRRIEHLFWIEEPAIQAQIEDLIAVYHADTAKAQELQPDGTYLPVTGEIGEPSFSAQDALIARAIGAAPVVVEPLSSPATSTSFVTMRPRPREQ